MVALQHPQLNITQYHLNIPLRWQPQALTVTGKYRHLESVFTGVSLVTSVL